MLFSLFISRRFSRFQMVDVLLLCSRCCARLHLLWYWTVCAAIAKYSAIKYTHRIRFVQSHLVVPLSLSFFSVCVCFFLHSKRFFLQLVDSLKYVVNHLLVWEKMHQSIKNSPLENAQIGELITMQKNNSYKKYLCEIYWKSLHSRYNSNEEEH